ncbi:hypothetical protein ACI3PL_24200, partial [Lacticaseibacillus paracasei]
MNETWRLAKARARHRLESPGYPSQEKSPGLGGPDSDRGLRFRWLTARRAMEMPLRPNAVVWCFEAAQI